ncbi:hypothetical protein [Leptospira phage LE3]|uniref:Uncharacterized protein n=2 Tax=Nylescharonvirus TaxID=2843431 RepID=A0A343LEG7_9CAUD|nr:hypothetical protein HWB33_gp66 [Leptospira phage LE3]YP_009835539.1 hypothetical protein HWB34_gp64 [Leptospira phage LE4]ATN95010.1 hypothetical protein [Leptospira phage LE3]ATN95077.1 hypothetical protein [Leptospira phage LE4]
MNIISKSYIELERTTSYLGEAQAPIIEAYIDYVECLVTKFGTSSAIVILKDLCMKNDPSGQLLQNIYNVISKLISNMISEIELNRYKNARQR